MSETVNMATARMPDEYGQTLVSIHYDLNTDSMMMSRKQVLPDKVIIYSFRLSDPVDKIGEFIRKSEETT